MAFLEHVNITVSDTAATAAWLGEVFGWKLRWQGLTPQGSETAHVGTDTSYIALYQARDPDTRAHAGYGPVGGLNHIGVVVEDMAEAERAVTQAGFKPHSHADYAPGRRFYFHDGDGIEWEVVSYAP